jgi:tetratricopeptide (TPR) repeat protein
MRKNGVKAMRSKPNLAVLWNNKGAEFVKLQQYDEAKRAFNQATEIKPDLVPAWFNLANVYAMEGKREEALTKLRRAVKTDPDFKKTAKKASCFKELWNDKDFKRLIN